MKRRRHRKRAIQKKTEGNDQFLKPTVQTKLSMGKPGDKYEVEADKMADQVVNNKSGDGAIQKKEGEEEVQQKPLASQITPLIQKMGASEEENTQAKLQRKEDEEPVQAKEEEEVQAKGEEEEVQAKGEEEEVQAKANTRHQKGSSIEGKLKKGSGGQQMDSATKAEMEHGFGADFSQVNIHTDGEAQKMSEEIGAQVFTHGNDIYFNKDKYDPNSEKGKHLLAHELTHTIQQKGFHESDMLQRQEKTPTTEPLKDQKKKKKEGGLKMNVNMSLPNIPSPKHHKTVKQLGAWEAADMKLTPTGSALCKSEMIDNVQHSYVDTVNFDISKSTFSFYIANMLYERSRNNPDQMDKLTWRDLYRKTYNHGREHFKIYKLVVAKVKKEMIASFSKLPSKNDPIQLPKALLQAYADELIRYWVAELKHRLSKATCNWEKKDYPKMFKGMNGVNGYTKVNCEPILNRLPMPLLPSVYKGKAVPSEKKKN